MSEKPIIKTLENGLRLVYVPFRGVDSATFRLVGRAGGLWEKPKEYGIAHYIEHLAFDGTKKYPNPDDLRDLIEGVGGSLNAYTSFEEVNYQVKVVKDEMERAFDFLSQQAMEPLFKNEDIEKQRTIINQEFNMALDNPVHNFQIKSQEHIFADKSRLQKPLIGTKKTLKTINREQIKNYFDRNYKAGNFVLAVCGGNIENKFFELSKKYFKDMQSGEKNEYTTNHYVDENSIYTEQTDKVQQASVSIIFKAPIIYSKDFYAAKFLQKIFGGSFSSRLFKEIRQKRGLAYRVENSYHATTPYGLFDLIAQVEPKNVEKVIKIMKTEIDKIVEKGITKKEFENTKNSITSAFIFNNESPEKRVYTQAKLVLEDREKENYETLLEKYMAVDIKQINQAAKEIFSHKPKFRVLSNKISDENVLNAWDD